MCKYADVLISQVNKILMDFVIANKQNISIKVQAFAHLSFAHLHIELSAH